MFDLLPPKGIDILMGMAFYELHPEGGTGRDKIDGLRALRSPFGSGWVVRGHHPNIKSVHHTKSKEATAMPSLTQVGFLEGSSAVKDQVSLAHCLPGIQRRPSGKLSLWGFCLLAGVTSAPTALAVLRRGWGGPGRRRQNSSC